MRPDSTVPGFENVFSRFPAVVDWFWRGSEGGRRGRVVRRKDQKDFFDADTHSRTKTSQTVRGEEKSNALSYCVPEKEEALADSGAEREPQSEIKIKEKEIVADSKPNRNVFSVRDARRNALAKSIAHSQSDRDADAVSICFAAGKERRAQRNNFA